MEIRLGIRGLVIGILLILLIATSVFSAVEYSQISQLNKKLSKMKKELAAERRGFLVYKEASEEATAITAKKVAAEEVSKRDELWKEGILVTFAHRKMPANLATEQAAKWNDTTISKLTGFRLETFD